MNKVEKHINSFTGWLLSLYLFHLGVEPILSYVGLSEFVFYILPIFVAFSTCYLFIKALETKKIKVLFELGFVFLIFIFLVFGVNKYSRIMSFIANPATDSYLQTLVNSKSKDFNDALHSDEHEKSRQMAHYFYSEFDLIIPFKNKESIYAPFEPTNQEIDNRAKREVSMAEQKDTLLLAAENAKNFEWMANYLLIAFGLSLFFFMCIAVYRQNKL
jgi:hypothetical protein